MINVLNLLTMYQLLKSAPNGIIHRIQIRWVWWPVWRLNEVRDICLQESHRVFWSVRWCTVLLEREIVPWQSVDECLVTNHSLENDHSNTHCLSWPLTAQRREMFYWNHDAFREVFPGFQQSTWWHVTFCIHVGIHAIVLAVRRRLHRKKIFSSENHVQLIVLCVIRFFRYLHAFSRFSSSAAVSACTLWRRNTLSFKLFFAILTTEERETSVCLANSHGLLLVPGWPPWLQINSSTNLMFESVLTERRRPLPRSLSALPDESIPRTRSYSVRHFHCLAGNSATIVNNPNPFQFLEFLSTNDPHQSKVPCLHAGDVNDDVTQLSAT